MTVALAALPQFFDNAGNPLSGGKVFTYTAGTLTPLATYTDRGGLTPNANPVVLDSAGRADIWLSTNIAYKLIVQDSVGNVMDSVDNYYAGADPSQLVAAGIVPATGGIYTGLVSFTGGATFDGTPAQDLATLDSLNIASVQNANLFHNSDMSVWQLSSTTSVTDNAYGFDRIVNLCETGSNTLSQLLQPADGIPYAMRITQPDALAKRVGFAQIAEARDCIAYRGKNLAFALKVRCSAATTVRCALVAWTGTLDSPTRDPVNNWASTTYTAGNFFVSNTSTIAVTATAVSAGVWTDMLVSSASAGGVAAPSSMTNLYMVVWTDTAQAQNATLDASVLRCGQGTVAPLWTPPNAQQELSKCLRFSEVGTTQYTTYGTAGLAVGYRVPFAVQKRVGSTPTLFLVGTGYSNGTGAVTSFPTVDSFSLSYTVIAAGAGTVTTSWIATANIGV
jgi:hypothetical protein